MKKRISIPVCIATLALCMVTLPALAAGEPYDPISVEKYTYGSFDELRIQKVYQLSPTDDPSGIPTEDFEQNGRLYYLLDITQQEGAGADAQNYGQASKVSRDVTTYTVTFGSKKLDKSTEQERGSTQTVDYIIIFSVISFTVAAILLTAVWNAGQKRGTKC